MKAACPTVSFPKSQLKASLKPTRISIILVYNFANPDKTNTFLKITLSLKSSVLLFSFLKKYKMKTELVLTHTQLALK